MPTRNTIKTYYAPAYYHVYNRGAGGQKIFIDSVDKQKFLSLLERHSNPEHKNNPEYPFPLHETQLAAYCLMGNHFHMLLYQHDDPDAITQLMRSVSTAYAMYFNKRHKRQGHLFQSIFKASLITDEAYLMHITRYIHMNPRTYMTYKWSSLRFYLGEQPPAWLLVELVQSMSPVKYRQFLIDYEGKKAELELLKTQIAG